MEHSQSGLWEATDVLSSRLQKRMHLSQILKCVIVTGLYENNRASGTMLIILKIDVGFPMEHHSSSLIINSHFSIYSVLDIVLSNVIV